MRIKIVVGLSLASVVVVAGLAAPAVAAQPIKVTKPMSVAEPTGTDFDEEVFAAATEAARTDQPVVVEELTSPVELVSAMPDGTMQAEISSVPVRVEVAGDWVPVDTDLTLRGEWLEPEASATPVRFSTGGTDELSQVQTASGEWFSERWPHGVLPAPIVSGSTATYREVLPGVDIKLTATELGMASVYVVKTEQAAESVALQDLHVVVDGADLSRTANGTFHADAGGEEQAVASSPLWWDSSEGGTFLEPGGDEPMRPVVHELSDDSISMDVPATVDGEDVQYPIFVDPDWTPGETYSWYTDAAYPNQSYLSASTSDVLRVGADGTSAYKSRMFYQFPLGTVKGKTVSKAVLNTTQLKVLWCAPTPIDLYVYGPQAAGFTWNGMSGTWGRYLGSSNVGKCGTPATAIGWTVTNGVKDKINSDYMQFGFTYASTSNYSRRHFSRDATLTITYNTVPSKPTAPTFTAPNAACSTLPASPVVLSNLGQVTLRAGFADPDGGNVKGRFRIVDAASLTTVFWSTETAFAAAGTRSVNVAAMALSDGSYAWVADAVDPNGLISTATAPCYFNVDSSGPQALPVVTATGPLVVGTPVTATFTTNVNDAVAFIAYTVTAGEEAFTFDAIVNPPACGSTHGVVRIVCPTADGTASVSIAPTASLSKIWAVSYDIAGNPARRPGDPGAPGTYGSGFLMTSANDPDVTFARGHVWRTQALPGPLGATVTGTNSATPVALALGTDALRTRAANVKAPAVPLQKSIIEFRDPLSYVQVDGFTLTTANPGGGESVSSCLVGAGQRSVCDLADTGSPVAAYTWTSMDQSGFANAVPVFVCDVSPTPGSGAVVRLLADSQCTIIPGAEYGVLVDGLGYALAAPPSGGPATVSAAPVLKQTESFTVAAWVRPGTGASAGVVTTDLGGANMSLGVNGQNWQFCLQPAPPASPVCATKEGAVNGAWEHLAGEWDAVNGQIRLYKNGELLSTVAFAWPVGTSSADVPIAVGSTLTNGVVTSRFAGAIADPGVFPGIATKAQLELLRDGSDPLNG